MPPTVPCVRQEEELKRLGLDPTQAHRLETAETAEVLYKKKQKKPAPEGWCAVARSALVCGARALLAGLGAKGSGSGHSTSC